MSPSVVRDHSRWRTKRRPICCGQLGRKFRKIRFAASGEQTEIEFCENFCRVLPLQGLAAKAGGRLDERHKTGMVRGNRRASGAVAAPVLDTAEHRVHLVACCIIPADRHHIDHLDAGASNMSDIRSYPLWRGIAPQGFIAPASWRSRAVAFDIPPPGTQSLGPAPVDACTPVIVTGSK